MTQSPDASEPTVRRVRIERRGGLAGLAVSAVHDFAALSAAQQQALAKVIDAAASNPPARTRGAPAGAAPGADRFSYRLHVEDSAGAERVIDLGEDAMPSILEPLAKPALP